jgi:hypothetical protein
MKFVVEIDTSTKTGTEALNYLKKLKSEKAVYIRKVKGDSLIPLSPEEMALPFGKKPTQKELDEFLDRKQGRGSDIEVVRKRILGRLARNRK